MTPAFDQFTDLRVAHRHVEGGNVAVLELQSHDGSSLPTWEPGAHIDIRTLDTQGNAVVRQYSLCGPQSASQWRVAILDERQGRGGSHHLFGQVKAGDTVCVRGPRNHFRLASSSEPAILVAGGIGITPVLSMAEQLHASGADFHLYYYGRSRPAMAFVEALEASPYADRVILSFDDQQPLPIDRLFQGVAPGTWLYTCGPEGFMRAVTEKATAHGIPESHIRKELFAATTADSTTGQAGQNTPFVVQLKSTGQTIEVGANESVVQALAKSGIEIVVSCEQGHCGSCLTRVIDGIPDHRDQFLLPEEQEKNDAFTPCCSRALSHCLVLDL